MAKTAEERINDLETSNKESHQKWSIGPEVSPYDVDLETIDPGNGFWFKNNRELEVFERLRKESPVHMPQESPFGDYWSLTRYDDIKKVDTDHKTFSSDIMNGGIRLGGFRLDEPPPDMFHLPMFIMQDPPVHDIQRKAVTPVFTGENLNLLKQLIQARTRDLIESLPEKTTFNWVRKVSVELTGKMLTTLFDVPEEDRHKLIHWSDTVERITDPEYFSTPAEGFAEIWKCFEYFNGFWDERKKAQNPGGDLISFLAHSEATKDMKPNEFLGNILLLIVGGNDTTRNSMSGGVIAFNEYPKQFEKLQKNPDLVSHATSEIIRWQSPVAHMCRTALRDVEIGGKQIKKWDKVAMWYLSGNRNEDYFPNANKLDIERENSRQHLSFGFGVHRCLGNRLAEMQLNLLWEEILKKIKRIEIVGKIEYLNSSFIRGITNLPVQIEFK